MYGGYVVWTSGSKVAPVGAFSIFGWFNFIFLHICCLLFEDYFVKILLMKHWRALLAPRFFSSKKKGVPNKITTQHWEDNSFRTKKIQLLEEEKGKKEQMKGEKKF